MSKYDEMWAAQETIDRQSALIRELVGALELAANADSDYTHSVAKDVAVAALSRVPEEYRG